MSCLTTIFSYIYRKKRPADIFRRAFPSEIGKIRRIGTLAERRSAATAEWDCFSRCGSEAAVAQTVLVRVRFRVPGCLAVSGAKGRRRGGCRFFDTSGMADMEAGTYATGRSLLRFFDVLCYGSAPCGICGIGLLSGWQRFGSGRRPVRFVCRGGTPKIGRTEEQSGSPREPEVGR